MRLFLFSILCLALSVNSGLAREADKPAPRVIYGLYSSQNHTLAKFSFIHQFLEMPLNHLGYEVEHYDVEKPLPQVGDNVKAIVVWLVPGTSVKNPTKYLNWLESAVDHGKKLIIIENLGISTKYRDKLGGIEHMNRLLNKIGVNDLNTWNELTYRAQLVFKDPEMVEFERPYSKSLSPFMDTLAIPGVGKSYLKARSSDDNGTVSDLVITSPKGGFIASGYAMFEGYQQPVPEDQQESIVNLSKKPPSTKNQPTLEEADAKDLQELLKEKDKVHEEEHIFPIQQWYVNPFKFLSAILQDEDIPKPDVTTLNGRRIFYSHIDADGWNNISEVSEYRKKKAITAQVVREKVLEAYPDMPFNVSIITSEMDLSCYGLKQSGEEAKKAFALDNVEPSSHTHSHPLAWGYFEDADPEKERPLLKLYPEKPGTGTSLFALLQEKIDHGGNDNTWKAAGSEQPKDYKKLLEKNSKNFEKFGMQAYETPRSYACEPFNIKNEIGGAAKIIDEQYAPAGKKVRLVQWPGDTTPFEEALKETREAGLLNINGGDSRFDNEYPSYASVSPIGIKVGNEQQIYSSNSNENTYTNLWTDRFYGYVYLQSTVWNTDHPIRVQPFNIYFHMYSGEKLASLNAVRANLNYARRQDVIRMFASDFAEIANSFYATELVPTKDGGWSIKKREEMNTLRLDDASLKTVDFDRSTGILGQRYYQGSLYVSLDPAVDEPKVYFHNFYPQMAYPASKTPYLIESNLFIKSLHKVKNSLMFDAHGWGKGKLKFKYPKATTVGFVLLRDGKSIEEGKINTDKNGILDITLSADVKNPVKITLTELAE